MPDLSPTEHRGLHTISRRAVLGGFGGLAALAVLPGRAAGSTAESTAEASASAMAALAAASNTVSLSTTWRFATDPDRIGESQQWYADDFDDSGWQSLRSGRSWESQGVDYAGFAWYRQTFTVPAASEGVPLTLILAAIDSDDEVWFNGVHIGGLTGQYKYDNRKLRTYTVSPSSVRYGQPNTLAVRVWGGNLEFHGRNSGLVAGEYQAELDPYRLMARKPGGSIGSELPLELWDLSFAQQGDPFELVLRLDPALVTGTALSYAVRDPYGTAIKTGTAPVTVGSDGIPRSVVSVDAATSRQIYLAGRLQVDTEMTGSDEGSEWVDTGTEITVNEPSFTDHYTVYRRTFEAGTVSLPPDGDNVTRHSMYLVAVVGETSGLAITDLVVGDTRNAADWSVRSNLQVGDEAFGDRTYPVGSLPAELVGAQWIRTAQDSKSSSADPLATFTISERADVYIGVETRAAELPWVRPVIVENLNFSHRDAQILPALPGTYEDTPYGSLKLIDVIDCATPLDTEVHPYLQSSFSESGQRFNTPGSHVDVSVTTILGRPARESAYGWFAYRVGRGELTVGATYLLRIEYPEDKPRYCPVEVQVGQNYLDVGWRNGVAPDDVYDPWPLSGAWQYYDVIVPVGKETVAAGGAGDGDGRNGMWVYFMNKAKPGFQLSLYEGGAAVATIKLYEIDAARHAPAVTRPRGLPHRVLGVDWERQPTHVPADIVRYAKLMGYSAVSPLTLKWAFDNYADPVTGYDAVNVDHAHYWVTSEYTSGSGQTPPPAVPGVASVHQQYLQATKDLGIDYVPRFEYGGSYDLPLDAQAVGSGGLPAQPNRFGVAGHLVANLLDTRTFADLKVFLDSLLKPYAAAHPQLRGALWRIRSDRMQPSYGPADVDLFCAETGTPKPAGHTDAQLAAWAATGEVGEAYSTWWQGKRAAFHEQVVALLRSYRPDLRLYYFNWDPDKFAMMRPDLNQGAFHAKINARGGPAAYAEDRAARATYTATDYTHVMRSGDFAGWLATSRPDYALRPELYADKPGIALMAPANWLCYADKPEYLSYFRTAEGVAVSNAVSYDEVGARFLHPKFEASMVLAGGGPFSLAMELLAYFHADARTLNYTVYTYGRGFADAHRRFAQAYLALPAVPGNVVAGTHKDVRARVYPTANGTYLGIAHRGHATRTLKVDLPGGWTAQTVVTNLVTGQVVPTEIVHGKLRIRLRSGPMELNAFLATGDTSGTFSIATSPEHQAVAPGQAATYTVRTAAVAGAPGSIRLHATGAPHRARVTFSPNPVPAGDQATMTVTSWPARETDMSSLTVTGTAGGLSATAYAGLTVKGRLSITDLWVADTAHSADWQIQASLRNQVAAYSDRNYTFSRVPGSLVGRPWVRTALDSKSATGNPLVTFTIDRPADVWLAVDRRLGRLPWMDDTWRQRPDEHFAFHDVTDTEIILDVYRKAFPAGEVALGPSAGGTFSGTYAVIVD